MPCGFTSLLQLIWISFSFPCSSSLAWACPHPQRRNPSTYFPVGNALCTKPFYVCKNFHRSAQSGAAIFMRDALPAERVSADSKKDPLLSIPPKTLVYNQQPLPPGRFHRFAQSGVPLFMQSARRVRCSRTEYPLLSMPTKTPFARFFFALAKTFIALHNRELRVLCGMPYR